MIFARFLPEIHEIEKLCEKVLSKNGMKSVAIYPITVTEQSVDMVGLMGTRGNLYSEDETSENTNGVRAD